MTRTILLSLMLAAAACNSDDTESQETSCDAVAEHLFEICDPVTGEDFRAICELHELPLVTPATRACIARTRQCTEASLEACDFRSVTIACSGDDDCPAPFQCDTELDECVRCMSDEDCGAGRGCLMGTCFDADSEFYRVLRELFQGDAGTASD